jgi:hypothetical protein
VRQPIVSRNRRREKPLPPPSERRAVGRFAWSGDLMLTEVLQGFRDDRDFDALEKYLVLRVVDFTT